MHMYGRAHSKRRIGVRMRKANETLCRHPIDMATKRRASGQRDASRRTK
jgi:hypothetical protein